MRTLREDKSPTATQLVQLLSLWKNRVKNHGCEAKIGGGGCVCVLNGCREESSYLKRRGQFHL